MALQVKLDKPARRGHGRFMPVVPWVPLFSKSKGPSTGAHRKSRLEGVCGGRFTRFVHHSQLSQWLPQTAVPGHNVFLKVPILTRTAS